MPLVLTLFFFFLALTLSVAVDELTCTTTRGQNKDIRYPFGFEGDKVPKAFKLKCNNLKVFLQVPNAGFYEVKRIDYNSTSITINGCVTPSAFSSNIHPFSTDLTNVTYFHCPSDFRSNSPLIRNVECMRSRNFTVVAIANTVVDRFKSNVSSCEQQISPYDAPTNWLNSSNDDVVLSWSAPGKTKTGLSEWKRIVSLVLLIFYCGFCMSWCWFCWRDRRARGNAADELERPCGGLQAAKMEAYPSVELGESMRLPNSNETTCPICLGDFKPKDTVKTIHCGHVFHDDCIDLWLRRRATCPVCRKMPDD